MPLLQYVKDAYFVLLTRFCIVITYNECNTTTGAISGAGPFQSTLVHPRLLNIKFSVYYFVDSCLSFCLFPFSHNRDSRGCDRIIVW